MAKSAIKLKLALLVALPLAACVPGILDAKQGLAVSERAGVAALRAFQQWDADHQTAVAEAARLRGDPEGGRRELDQYRGQRGVVLLTGAGFNAAVATAHAAISAAEAAPTGRFAFGEVLARVATAAGDLAAAIRNFQLTLKKGAP